jgi:hypothetical protein
VDSDGTGNYEVLDEVKADHVTITQGGAGVVEAESIEITQGGVQAAQTGSLSITQGGAMIVEADSADLSMSGAGLLSADRVDMKSAGAGVAIADTLVADDKTTIGFLFAGTIEGQPKVRVDARVAAAFGAGLGVALFVLRRFARRK